MQTKLLLVEDDPEIARIVRDMLLREGYEVTWATTGLEGWEDFRDVKYDLVLVDLMLPEMDGFTLCKNIRLKSNVPIIIISARQADEDKIEALGIGADDYVAKPFSIVELKARIESQLRRWNRYQGIEGNKSEKVRYANGLSIHFKQRNVWLHDEKVTLTVKEFELLTLLSNNPEQVFSKEELYEHIWSELAAEGLHTVIVHMKSLRAKLADSVKTPLFIQTVWGKGYRFIGEML